MYFSPFVFSLDVLGIVYTSLTAIRQTHLKRLIVNTSVVHTSLVMIGPFNGTMMMMIGVEAAVLLTEFKSQFGFVSSTIIEAYRDLI